MLYSPIEPQCDVVEFLAPHFCDRFKNEAFLIHDVRRGKALAAYQGEWYVRGFTRRELDPFSKKEKDYQNMWKTYFKNMAIRERLNPRCQKNRMPMRYWKHLTEFHL